MHFDKYVHLCQHHHHHSTVFWEFIHVVCISRLFFLSVSNIPLNKYSNICLFIHLMDIYISSFWLLTIKML